MKIDELKKFCESLGSPVLVVDSEDGKIVFFNERASELIGYSDDDSRKIDFKILFDGKSQNRVIAAVDLLGQSEEGQKIKENGLQLRRKAGRYIPVSVSGSVAMLETKKVFLFSLDDLSEIHRLQDEQEKMKEEMHQVSKLADIGRLAAGMAHELNNPLAVIQGFAENIQWMVDEKDVDVNKLKTQVDPILRQTNRMGKIISKMMSMARGGDPEMEIISMRSMVQGSILFFESMFDHFNVDAQIDIDHGLMFACDVTRIEQIVINIVNNAIHALEKKNDERKLRFEGYIEKNSVIMKIWNNGPDIPNEVKEKIFTPFFTTKSVGEGTGLGLFLSYSIMKAHGGDMWFESEPGKGTSFFLKFKKADSKENSDIRHKSKVLIVDDESFFRQIFLRKLGRFGYDVVSVKGTAEALQVLETDPEIIAVFTDLRMPQATGVDLVKAVRGSNKDVLIFVVTGYGQDPLLQAAVPNYKIDGILKKPLDQGELTSAVEKIRLFSISRLGKVALGA